jgi:hypothetical protein
MAGADNNQQNVAAGAAKTADVVAAGAEVALAGTVAAAAAAEAVALAAAEMAAVAAAIAMAMVEGETRGRGRDWGYVGVPRIQLGNYLAPSKAMFLANVYLEGSHIFADRQSFICTADRFICSRR